MQSRNQREGRYVGACFGQHFRYHDQRIRPNAEIASWLLLRRAVKRKWEICFTPELAEIIRAHLEDFAQPDPEAHNPGHR